MNLVQKANFNEQQQRKYPIFLKAKNRTVIEGTKKIVKIINDYDFVSASYFVLDGSIFIVSDGSQHKVLRFLEDEDLIEIKEPEFFDIYGEIMTKTNNRFFGVK